ncbi:hypothetical protein D3C75_657000 [compost metagenome]
MLMDKICADDLIIDKTLQLRVPTAKCISHNPVRSFVIHLVKFPQEHSQCGVIPSRERLLVPQHLRYFAVHAYNGCVPQ